MEAKLLCVRKRDPVHRVLLTTPRIQFTKLKQNVHHQFSRFCEFLWNVIKARDPLLDLLICPGDSHHDAESNDRARRNLGRRFAAMLPGNSTVGFAITNGLLNFLLVLACVISTVFLAFRNFYEFALVGRLILTWFPSRPPLLERPLSIICDPYLNLFKGLIPVAGNIDFSSIIAFVVLSIFSAAAAALPAEIKERKIKLTKQDTSE